MFWEGEGRGLAVGVEVSLHRHWMDVQRKWVPSDQVGRVAHAEKVKEHDGILEKL